MGKKVKNIYYLETIAAISLKVGLSIQMNELMRFNEYQRPEVTQNSKIKTCFSRKLMSHLEPKFI